MQFDDCHIPSGLKQIFYKAVPIYLLDLLFNKK